MQEIQEDEIDRRCWLQVSLLASKIARSMLLSFLARLWQRVRKLLLGGFVANAAYANAEKNHHPRQSSSRFNAPANGLLVERPPIVGAGAPPLSLKVTTTSVPPPTLEASCRCGDCTLHLTLVDEDFSLHGTMTTTTSTSTTIPPHDTVAVDCHCPSCRKFHTTAFVSFVRARISVQGKQDDSSNCRRSTPPWQSYRHECAQLGTVDRYFCRRCFAKLATKPVKGDNDDNNNNNNNIAGMDHADADDDNNIFYVNMGSLVDESIEADYSAAWRKCRQPWQMGDPSRMAPWYPAHPDYVEQDDEEEESLSGDGDSDGSSIISADDDDEKQQDPTVSTMTADIEAPLPLRTSVNHLPPLQGSCACGAARYQIQHWDIPSHMPHCYCHVCRRSSGSAFLSWIHCRTHHFAWLSPEPLKVRTTNIGFRHVCGHCSCNLTLVYDEEEGHLMWPTAGSVDDASWRKVRTFLQKRDGTPQASSSSSLSSETAASINHRPEALLRHSLATRLGGCADQCLEDVSHIYCAFRSQWYELPDDGLPRWDE